MDNPARAEANPELLRANQVISLAAKRARLLAAAGKRDYVEDLAIKSDAGLAGAFSTSNPVAGGAGIRFDRDRNCLDYRAELSSRALVHLLKWG